jgi:hypothetical protein
MSGNQHTKTNRGGEELISGFTYQSQKEIKRHPSALIARVRAAISSRETLFYTLSKQLYFPVYFGRTWDALYELLCDLHWLNQDQIVILHEDIPKLPEDERRTYVEILCDSVRWWTDYYHDFTLTVSFPSERREYVEDICLTRANKPLKQSPILREHHSVIDRTERGVPVFWHFMVGSTWASLEDLVWCFSFDDRVGKAAYTNVRTPQEIIAIVDGLKNTVIGHYHLKRLRDYVQTTLSGIYAEGEDSARQRWEQASSDEKAKLEAVSPEDVQKIARELAPKDRTSSEQSWFIEAFCRRWGDEWLEYLKQTHTKTSHEDE